MKLPNGAHAQVPPDKLVGYLLSMTHPIGAAKAKFFRAFGFDDSNARLLESELLTVARVADVKHSVPVRHGIKYVLIGQIDTPAGRRVTLETVWIIESDSDFPRFVTAYPL